MTNNKKPEKKLWTRIAVLIVAGIMIAGAVILPFLR